MTPRVPFLPSHQVIARAERAVALLGRCRPRNAQSEAVRLQRAWAAGDKCQPRWCYDPVPDFSELRRMLTAFGARPRTAPELRTLLTERVQEIALESRLVEAIGRGETMTRLARARFEPHARALMAADELAQRWVNLKPNERSDVRSSISDDSSDPNSLLCRMRARVGTERLPVRVEVSSQLIAAAATGDGVIIVATGRRLLSTEVERIVEHEVTGHAWPRIRAVRQRVDLFASASSKGNDVQEGYALWCEERAGTLDERRCKELGLRHLAATTVWRGADWVETTEALIGWGAELPLAIQIASRVHRAGGLAREIVYLPNFCLVHEALKEDPHTVDWLAAGRLSLDAIRVLRHLGLQLVR